MMEPVTILGQQGAPSVNPPSSNASSYARNPNVYESNPNVYGRNPNVYERNPNAYESNPNVYARNPNVIPDSPVDFTPYFNSFSPFNTAPEPSFDSFSSFNFNPVSEPSFDPFSGPSFDPSSYFNLLEPSFNPMMESVPILGQQGFIDPSRNLEPVTFLPYADDVTPSRANALSVFTQGGDLKPGIDVSAITPSPETPPSLFAVDTVLNQEVPFDPPTSSSPDFSGAGISLSPFTKGILDALKRGVTQPQVGMRGFDPEQNPYGDTLAVNASDFSEADEDSEKSVSTAKEKEEERPFLGSPNTPSGLGGPLLRGFNMVNNASRNVPMGEEQTKALLAQRFGFDNPVTVNQAIANNPNLVMGTDAQGRMRTFASPAARQQNLANSQIAFNQASQDRQARIGGTGSFEGDSAARNARVAERDKRPGETQTERDTRIAKSRTQGSTEAGEMSFNDARKFVPKGQKETAKSYNQRIKAYQAQQNSRLNKLKENLEELRVTGQELNNQRTAAIISNYAENQPQKYSEVLADAQKMYEDGRIKDRYGMAVYIIEEMGGDLSKLTDGVDGFNPSQLNTKDRQAYDYAINNPDDPRSQQILDKLGVK